MPTSATRKCHIRRQKANVTRKIASKRRKLFQEYVTIYTNSQQKMLDVLYSLHKHMNSGAKGSLGKLMETMINPENIAKIASYTFPVTTQMLQFPPMSEKQETIMIQQAERSLQQVKEVMKTMMKQLPKDIKIVTYSNPYPIKRTNMPNLYVGNAECSWESEAGIDTLYKKRLATLEQVQKTLTKNEKIFGDMKMKGTNINTMLITFYETLELFKTIPPGPTKESEQERIAFLTHQMGFFKTIMNLIQSMMKELRIIMKRAMKQAK